MAAPPEHSAQRVGMAEASRDPGSEFLQRRFSPVECPQTWRRRPRGWPCLPELDYLGFGTSSAVPQVGRALGGVS
jgi:hypothetical protein